MMYFVLLQAVLGTFFCFPLVFFVCVWLFKTCHKDDLCCLAMANIYGIITCESKNADCMLVIHLPRKDITRPLLFEQFLCILFSRFLLQDL